MPTRLWTTITGILCGKSTYTPPRVWTWDAPSGGEFENINRPVAGATHEKELPIGKHPLQLYSLATPNGVKVTVMLEELLALGFKGAEYDAWLVDIGKGEQFGSGFVGINPNSKIPALIDRNGRQPVRLFESGAILLYLADKFGGADPWRSVLCERNACPGCSGKWAARRILEAVSGTFMPTRRRNSNTPSTVMPWK